MGSVAWTWVSMGRAMAKAQDLFLPQTSLYFWEKSGPDLPVQAPPWFPPQRCPQPTLLQASDPPLHTPAWVRSPCAAEQWCTELLQLEGKRQVLPPCLFLWRRVPPAGRGSAEAQALP